MSCPAQDLSHLEAWARGDVMKQNTSPSSTIELTCRQRDLQANLAIAIRRAIPAEIDLDKAQQRAQDCYRVIAELLVDLRHEFPGPDGEPYDLQGRSSAYRTAVREAYAQAGADVDRPIPKRLTAGAAYWVRKILIERYGEKALYESGIIRHPPIEVLRHEKRLVVDIVVENAGFVFESAIKVQEPTITDLKSHNAPFSLGLTFSKASII
jgi:hypothetical protein